MALTEPSICRFLIFCVNLFINLIHLSSASSCFAQYFQEQIHLEIWLTSIRGSITGKGWIFRHPIPVLRKKWHNTLKYDKFNHQSDRKAQNLWVFNCLNLKVLVYSFSILIHIVRDTNLDSITEHLLHDQAIFMSCSKYNE